MNPSPAPETSFFSSWLKEPLVHFLAIAVVTWWVAPTPEERNGVDAFQSSTVAGGDASAVEEVLQERLGRTPTEAELTAEKELMEERTWLLEEAVRMGLHVGDKEVEERLMSQLANVVVGALPPPTEEELRAWYSEETSKKTERTVAFTQLFFPVETTEQALKEHLAELERNGEQKIPGVRVGRVASARERSLSRRMPPLVVKHVLEAPLKVWQQVSGTTPPLVIRVEQREAGSPRPFEQVRGEVQQDWQRYKRLEALRRWVREKREAQP